MAPQNTYVPLLEVSHSVAFRYPFDMVSSGTGGFKVGANYAPGVVPQTAAAQKGYQQNLWLHGPEHYLTEVSFNSFRCFEIQFGLIVSGWDNEHVYCIQKR